MTDLRRSFVEWCERELDSLIRQHLVFTNGTCKMHSNGVDITEETVASIKKNIDELSALIVKSKREGW